MAQEYLIVYTAANPNPQPRQYLVTRRDLVAYHQKRGDPGDHSSLRRAKKWAKDLENSYPIPGNPWVVVSTWGDFE